MIKQLITKDHINLTVEYDFPENQELKPPYTTFVLIHGHASNRNSNSHQRFLPYIKENYANIRFDFRGHGDSDSILNEANLSNGLEDLETVMSWLKEQSWVDKNNLFATGSSYGGAIVMLYASAHPDDFKGISLKCAVSDWPTMWFNRMGQKGIKQWELLGEKASTPYSFYLDAKQYDIYSLVENVNSRVIALHGENDYSIPYSHSQKLVEHLKEAEFFLIKDADHTITEDKHFNIYATETLRYFNLV